MNLKFKEKFDKLTAEGAAAFELRGSNLLIEIVRENEERRSAGGIIIAQDPNHLHGTMFQHKMNIGVVLMTGEGYYSEDGDVPLETKVGDIILLPQFALTPMSTFPGLDEPTENRLALVKDEQIVMRFKGPEGLNKVQELLNA